MGKFQLDSILLVEWGMGRMMRDLSVAKRKECGYSTAGHWLFSSHGHWGGSIQVGAVLNHTKFQERAKAIYIHFCSPLSHSCIEF